MQIITVGVVVDINDPRGFGRIRARDITETDSARADAIPNWDKWSKNDPFVYSPFLPNHINIIPQIQQSVKLIRFDNEKDLQNQEYVPGPYTTPHDFLSQDQESQLTETTFGARSKKTPAIKSFSSGQKVYGDNYIKPESVATLPKLNDIALVGNYGSDLILTEQGLQLRAGKFIDKFTNNPRLKNELKNYPIVSKKQAKVSLKKFPETLKLDFKEIQDSVIVRGDIMHVFEYDIDDLTNPQTLNFKITKINKPEGDNYKTDVFNIDTTVSTTVSTLLYDKTITLETDDKIKESYILIRDLISSLDRDKLSLIDATLPDTNSHPFFFRPSKNIRSYNGSTEFLQNIKYLDRSNGYGLVYSKDSLEPEIKPEIRKVPYLKKISDVDQTFAAVTSDFIFNLSTQEPGVDGKKINFTALDKYEFTQEDYVMNILPNTFSTVRGEKLIDLLELMTAMLLNHTHGIATPPNYWEASKIRIEKLINSARIEMLNRSVRIN
jgi:hypothetical protein